MRNGLDLSQLWKIYSEPSSQTIDLKNWTYSDRWILERYLIRSSFTETYLTVIYEIRNSPISSTLCHLSQFVLGQKPGTTQIQRENVYCPKWTHNTTFKLHIKCMFLITQSTSDYEWHARWTNIFWKHFSNSFELRYSSQIGRRIEQLNYGWIRKKLIEPYIIES